MDYLENAMGISSPECNNQKERIIHQLVSYLVNPFIFCRGNILIIHTI